PWDGPRHLAHRRYCGPRPQAVCSPLLMRSSALHPWGAYLRVFAQAPIELAQEELAGQKASACMMPTHRDLEVSHVLKGERFLQIHMHWQHQEYCIHDSAGRFLSVLQCKAQ